MRLFAITTIPHHRCAVFELVLGEWVDSGSINVLTFGGPALLLVDRRNMQQPKSCLKIIVSPGNAAWNATKTQFLLNATRGNNENSNY